MTKHDKFKHLVSYDEATGTLIWRVSTSPRGPVGTPVGWQTANGYTAIKITELDIETTLARAVWFYFTGNMPSKPIRHINGDKNDNRIQNLYMVGDPAAAPAALKFHFRYDEETGHFFGLQPRKGKPPSNTEPVGWKNDAGYTLISFLGKIYRAHRLAWLYHYGEWPASEIDHINGNPADNRIDNLRLVDRVGNMGNLKKPRTNTSGYKGVSWNQGAKKWMAMIRHNNRQHYLGLFECPKEAHAAYAKMAQTLRGGKSRTN